MKGELKCADLIPELRLRGSRHHDSDVIVMKKAAEHAKRAHRMIAIGDGGRKTARAAIRDVVGDWRSGR